jgi:hypothetical protein
MVGTGPVVGKGGSVGCTITTRFCVGITGCVFISDRSILVELDGLQANKNRIKKNDSIGYMQILRNDAAFPQSSYRVCIDFLIGFPLNIYQ